MFKKLTRYIFPMAFLAFSGGCTNELPGWPEPGQQDSLINLAKAPEVYAWSGNQVLENIYGTRTMNLPAMYSANVNGNEWSSDWDCVDNVYPELTSEDLAEIKRRLSPGHEVSNEIIISFENYWVQQVYKGESSYYATDKNGTQTNTEVTGSNQMDYLVSRNGNDYEHINNFNYGDNQTTFGTDGCGIAHTGTTLMTEMSLDGITPNNQFGYHETWGNQNNNRYDYHYIVIEYKGYYYVGFDYHAETDRQNPGEASKFDRDWNFTDWIVRISPAYAKGTTPDQPGKDDPTVTPGENLRDIDHVEVNLSIEQREGVEWLASHLSIHVRAVTDVEIFIPLPAKYYCAVDDLAIVQKHAEDLVIHGGPKTTTFTLNGFSVSLTVAFETSGIRVTTDGINEDVIKHCNDNFGDGITFEVWNYMNLYVKEYNGPEHGSDILGFGQENEITVDELKNYLNQSEIRFLDKEPSLYVNAFNKTESGVKFSGDCIVSIVLDQEGNYSEGKTGDWFNGSSFNELYYRKDQE